MFRIVTAKRLQDALIPQSLWDQRSYIEKKLLLNPEIQQPASIHQGCCMQVGPEFEPCVVVA